MTVERARYNRFEQILEKTLRINTGSYIENIEKKSGCRVIGSKSGLTSEALANSLIK